MWEGWASGAALGEGQRSWDPSEAVSSRPGSPWHFAAAPGVQPTLSARSKWHFKQKAPALECSLVLPSPL